jgi:hypothetical protein
MNSHSNFDLNLVSGFSCGILDILFIIHSLNNQLVPMDLLDLYDCYFASRDKSAVFNLRLSAIQFTE